MSRIKGPERADLSCIPTSGCLVSPLERKVVVVRTCKTTESKVA